MTLIKGYKLVGYLNMFFRCVLLLLEVVDYALHEGSLCKAQCQ